MRTITDHIVNPANDRLRIFVVDEPGQGGANHEYRVEAMHWLQQRTIARMRRGVEGTKSAMSPALAQEGGRSDG